jgi:hypothetical protein
MSDSVDDPGRAFRLPERRLSSPEFWNVYFSGGMNRLVRRVGVEFIGEFDQPDPGEWLPRDQPFQIGVEDLASYHYADDLRFSFGPQVTLGGALSRVVLSPPLNVETPRNWAQLRMASKLLGSSLDGRTDEYALHREAVANSLMAVNPTMTDIVAILEQLAPTREDYELFRETGDLRAVHMARELFLKALGLAPTSSQASDVLVTVVHSPFEPSDSKNIAIWALGRQNDPSVVPFLIGMLNRPEMRFYSVSIERALQFLLSGEHLQEISYEHEHEHWRGIFENIGERSREEWDEASAHSVYWEKRLRCAQTGVPRPELLKDEVEPVRFVAINSLVTEA